MKAFLTAHEAEMVAWLERLVNQDSGSFYKEGIDKVGAMLQAEYEAMGLQVEVVKEREYGNHLIIRPPQLLQKPAILIIAHLDTVFPVGTAAQRPFTIRGERAYGPGVIDMKGSLVTLLYALKALQLRHGSVLPQLEILLNSDEEIGSPSSQRLTAALSKGKRYGLVMEPARANGDLVSARKGGGVYELRVTGRAAHAGVEPERGIHAIHELAHHILQLQALNGVEPGVTINVGWIEGGTTSNTVPAVARALIDVRVTTMEQMVSVARRIEQLTARPFLSGVQLQLAGGITRPPMVKTRETLALLQLMEEAGKELGIPIRDTHTGGGSDGNFLAAHGVPTLDGLGPVGGNAHGEEEYLYLPSLVERSLLLATFLLCIAKRLEGGA